MMRKLPWPERGLRGAALKGNVAVDERVLELLTSELVEGGGLVLHARSPYRRACKRPSENAQPKYGASPITCSSRSARELFVGDPELSSATPLRGVLTEELVRGPSN